MGTNYYWRVERPPVCEHCGRGPRHDDYHIGKSSAGWTFGFHAEPELDVNTFRDWLRVFGEGGGRIVDEYNREHTPCAFVKMVLRKRRAHRSDGAPNSRHADEYGRVDDSYLDPEGHSFSPGWFS